MPPDTPRLALPLLASLFHDINNFYHYDLMILLKNVCTNHRMGPHKSASNRAPHLLRPALSLGQWFPTFFDAFLPLLILELSFLPYGIFIPLLFGFVG